MFHFIQILVPVYRRFLEAEKVFTFVIRPIVQLIFAFSGYKYFRALSHSY